MFSSTAFSLRLPAYEVDNLRDYLLRERHNPLISLPERVENYLDVLEGKLDAPYLDPVSCYLLKPASLEELIDCMSAIKRGAGVKVILDGAFPVQGGYAKYPSLQVQDSMEDVDGLPGIISGLKAVARGEVERLDFSLLRPAGSPTRGGLTASGPESFAKIEEAILAYRRKPNMGNLLLLAGELNAQVRQGGMKKGIIIISMPTYAKGKELHEFLDFDLGKVKGSVKREVRFPKGQLWQELPAPTRRRIQEQRQFTSLLLAKEGLNPRTGAVLYTNVCEGLYLEPKQTCLIVRVPLGRLDLGQLTEAYLKAYEFATNLHRYWHATRGERPHYARFDNDMQVAVDTFGLANLLHRERVLYPDFVDSLRDYAEGVEVQEETDAYAIVKALVEAHMAVASANVGQYDRVLCIEPAQAHAFREKDEDGFTFARGIWAPWATVVERVSDTEGVSYHEFPGPDITDLPPELTWQLNELWFRVMLGPTGVAHAISADTYHVMDSKDLEDWLENSPLPSLYYAFHEEYQQRTTKTVVEVTEEDEDLGALTAACDITDGMCTECGS